MELVSWLNGLGTLRRAGAVPHLEFLLAYLNDGTRI